MAREAEADGITTVVATPHSTSLSLSFAPSRVAVSAQKLQEELARRGLSLKVVPGLENSFTPDLLERLEKGRVLPLQGSRCLLLELPYLFLPPYSEDFLFQLQLKGFIPILAHPERSLSLPRDLEFLERVVEKGVLVQLTAASLEGAFGREVEQAARSLLRRGLAHIIATDAHSPSYPRPPRLSRARAIASRAVGEERAQAMVAAFPQAILEGKRVSPGDLPKVATGRRWF